MIKTIYNTDDDIPASEWVKAKNINKTQASICLKSAISVAKRTRHVDPDILSIMITSSNKIQENARHVYLINAPSDNNNSSQQILVENFAKATTLFTARRCIKGNWINDKDEYLEPKHD